MRSAPCCRVSRLKPAAFVRRIAFAALALASLGACSSSQGTQGGSSGAGTSGSAGAAGNGGGAGASGSGDTWDSYASGFMSMYCVSCHNDDDAGVASRNFHLLSAVQVDANIIACGLSKSQTDWSARGCTSPPARQFPIGNGPKPSDAERDRLIAWIDAGTP